MTPSPYLLRVLSKPTKVDEQTWLEWYTKEHVNDVVDTGTTTRGALYRAYNDFALQTKTTSGGGETKLHNAQLSHFDELPDDKTFCAVYQTDFEQPFLTENIKNVRQNSELMPEGGPYMPCADWDSRVYKLIQNYDPDNLGEGTLCIERLLDRSKSQS